MTDHLQRDVDGYLATIARLEPDIHMIDNGAAAASIAISLKRIADSLELLAQDRNEYGESPFAAIGGNLARALRNLK